MAHKGRWLLPLALGFSDGILNALVLASAVLLHRGHDLTLWLAFRVALVALVTAIFTVFVAEYAHLRAELTRAEHELNFTTPGRLAASRLGRTIVREAVGSAFVASIASFAGAMLPLVVGASIPRYPWCSLLSAFACLGMLGVALSRSGGGRRLTWSVALVACGIVVTFVGTQLKIA